jgi:uncharacterized protein YndB with AHSA1/START domain
MDQKTKIKAEVGKQELVITREFDLPLELLFKAHVDPLIVEQWMGSKVLKMESKKHGSYQLEKTDGQGNVVFKANGVFHEVRPDQKITRTFEMENAPFGVQLELIEFEPITDATSKLKMHVIYESGTLRDQALKVGMVQGINMAHNRLQEIANKLK